MKFEVFYYDGLNPDEFIGEFELKFDNNGYNSEDRDGDDEYKILENPLKNKDGSIVLRKNLESELKLQIKIKY